MKKLISVLLALTLVLCLAACGAKGGDDTTTATATDAVGDSTAADGNTSADENTTAAPISNAPGYSNGMTEKFDQMEYVAYTDLFYNGNTADYADKAVTKTGVFASIIDCWNGNITRYYVWGYADTTKCCCYQWEFVAPEGWTAPENGSTITVKGTLKQNDAALDKYWIEDCEITTDSAFKAADVDYDLTRISPTLVYVQVANMLKDTSYFEGKTVRLYGRAYTTNTIQHPYVDGSWQLDFTKEGFLPSIGEYMVLTGSFTSGHIEATDLQIVD